MVKIFRIIFVVYITFNMLFITSCSKNDAQDISIDNHGITEKVPELLETPYDWHNTFTLDV